jgi:hypothetical protein
VSEVPNALNVILPSLFAVKPAHVMLVGAAVNVGGVFIVTVTAFISVQFEGVVAFM